MSKYGVISGPYFLAFGLNTEIYYVFGHFSRNGYKHKIMKGENSQKNYNNINLLALYFARNPSKLFDMSEINVILIVLAVDVITGGF